MDFVGGSTFSTTHSITGTSDPTLYQTVRYAPTLTYNIPVVNDTYTVTLYFAEIYFNAPGQRVFNVSIEGQTVLQNFDIWAVAGQFAAVQRTFVVTVTDGVLNIVAPASVDNANFSAIKVVPGIFCTDSYTNGNSHVHSYAHAYRSESDAYIDSYANANSDSYVYTNGNSHVHSYANA